MITIVLVIHLLVATALVGVILLQRSEGGALGGLGGGTFGGLMSARGSANLLTRTTAILAAGFVTTSILLAILASRGGGPSSILDRPAPAVAPAPQLETTPPPAEAPAEPSAPVAR